MEWKVQTRFLDFNCDICFYCASLCLCMGVCAHVSRGAHVCACGAKQQARQIDWKANKTTERIALERNYKKKKKKKKQGKEKKSEGYARAK
jgi:hypothetical protein